ncbi:MAG: Bug family tripartite tricarboxylate transporter substrate binding protein [Vibrio hibernica]
MKKSLSILTAASFLMVSFLPTSAQAQDDWPKKNITLVVPFAAGGSTDILSRRVAELLQNELDTPVVVENRPGAGSTIATGQLARERRDVDYRILMASPGHTINASIYKSLPYDPITSFRFLVDMIKIPNVMVIPKSSPYNSVGEFITAAKSKQMSFSSSGIGSSIHMSGELFKYMTGLDKMVHIPYRGSGEALPALLAGDVDVSFENLPTINGLIKSGQVKALAVTTEKRSVYLPNLPTLNEVGANYGLKNYDTSAWFGLIANKNMSDDAYQKLIIALQKVKKSKEFHDFLPKIGAELAPEEGDAFRDFVAKDIRQWAELVNRIGLSK